MVVHACAEEANSLGILPLPLIEEPGPAWWAQLAPAGEKGPRVAAKLPFLLDGEDVLSGFVIGTVGQESSGNDKHLPLLEIAPTVCSATLQTRLKNAGLPPRLVAAGKHIEKKTPAQSLL